MVELTTVEVRKKVRLIIFSRDIIYPSPLSRLPFVHTLTSLEDATVYTHKRSLVRVNQYL